MLDGYHIHSNHSTEDLRGILWDLSLRPRGHALILEWLCDILDRAYPEHKPFLDRCRVGDTTLLDIQFGCDGLPALWWAGIAALDVGHHDQAYLSASRIIEGMYTDEEAEAEDVLQYNSLLDIAER